MMTLALGSEIGTDCAVFIAYLVNDDMRPFVTADDWGDRAAVVEVDSTTNVLTVAPDNDDSLVYVQISPNATYTIDRQGVAL